MNEPAVAAPAQTAAEITRASKSNLALAFVALSRERRRVTRAGAHSVSPTGEGDQRAGVRATALA